LTLYIDSSALLERYVEEHDSEAAVRLMSDDPVLVTCRLTEVEVRRNLSRLLDGSALSAARRQFAADVDAFALARRRVNAPTSVRRDHRSTVQLALAEQVVGDDRIRERERGDLGGEITAPGERDHLHQLGDAAPVGRRDAPLLG
jgi:hypothetical protein